MSENYSNSNRRGSIIAKSGFKREDDVVRKFNNWQEDKDARAWLVIMGYNLFEIECVEAKKISGQKTDIQVRVRIQTTRAVALENISVKLVSNRHGFNQVDKRRVDAYAQLWDMPNDIVTILKLFTGEKKSSRSDLKDPRRMFFSEMAESDQKKNNKFFFG
ncbi:MAG: hypothetical protein NZO16_07555 [Deltaproteobacteria bacterium]|nr:hypothetical protein [Deltaproteobacteria bacterium]